MHSAINTCHQQSIGYEKVLRMLQSGSEALALSSSKHDIENALSHPKLESWNYQWR
jgi:hypothetical protein